MNTEAPPEEPRRNGFAISIYLVAFVTGAIVMSFEMLGSRYLAPAFGAGIYTWASLISTVLAALCAGYFLGGYAADRYPSPAILGATVAIGSIYMLLLPAFSEEVVQFFAWQIDDIKIGQPRRRDGDHAVPGHFSRDVLTLRDSPADGIESRTPARFRERFTASPRQAVSSARS